MLDQLCNLVVSECYLALVHPRKLQYLTDLDAKVVAELQAQAFNRFDGHVRELPHEQLIAVAQPQLPFP